jgi:hypothetical protein
VYGESPSPSVSSNQHAQANVRPLRVAQPRGRPKQRSLMMKLFQLDFGPE